MLPTPAAIVEMVTAGANALTEVAKLLQTPAGQKQLEQMTSDRQKWDEFWAPVATASFWTRIGGGLKAFFSGDLFK